jgi:hypothetical protein
MKGCAAMENSGIDRMNKQQLLWMAMKVLSYSCLGLIVYNLFCLKGT